MAIVINGLLKGKLGNHIYSIRKGKNYVREVRKVTVTSEAMLARQQLFAKAGKMYKSLRHEIRKTIYPAVPGLMHTRMMSALVHWVTDWDKRSLKTGNHMSYFNNCHFTKEPGMKDRWHLKLQFAHAGKDLVQLTIPAFMPWPELRVAPNTCSVECKIIAAGCLAEDGSTTGSYTTTISFDYNDKEHAEQIIDLALPTPPGSLIVLAMSLEYTVLTYGYRSVNTNTKFMSSGIAGAVYVH